MLSNVEDIDVWNFRQQRFMWRNLGSEVKTSDLAAHFHAILALQIRFCLLFKRSTNIQEWQN